MKEETIHKAWKIWGIISIILVVLMGLMISSLNSTITVIQDNYEGYQYVPEGKQMFYCDQGQSYLCYNQDTQTATYCNLAEGLYANCAKRDTNFAQCQQNQFPVCIDDDSSWTTCKIGSKASCLDSAKWAIWNGNYAISCAVGETATCV